MKTTTFSILLVLAIMLGISVAGTSYAIDITLGDIDNFSSGDAADIITYRSQRVIDMCNDYTINNTEGAISLDFDQYAYNDIIGWTFQYDLPIGATITSAYLTVHMNTNLTDLFLFEDMISYDADGEFTRVRFNDYGVYGGEATITVDLSNAAYYLYDDGILTSRNFIADLYDGEFDVVVLDDSEVDYATLTINTIPEPSMLLLLASAFAARFLKK